MTVSTRAIVVRSLHNGGAGIVRALAPHFDVPPAEIAARIFRAPAVLVVVPESLAAPLAGTLAEAGLDVEVADAATTLPTQRLFDLAVYVRDAGQVLPVAAELARLMGTSLAEAAGALCAAPAAVLGGVSQATVDAVRARLEPLGAEVDASTPGEARYDIFMLDGDPSSYAVARSVLGALGVPVGPPPLVAGDLDHATAQRAWRELSGRRIARVVDHTFERFDVSLTAAPAGPAFLDALVAATGMPAALAPRVLARLPVVLFSGLRRAELEARTAPLLLAGATLRSELVTFRSFVPVISAVGDLDATAEALTSIAELADAKPRLARLPVTLPALGDLRARWLQAEVKRLGGRISLEAR